MTAPDDFAPCPCHSGQVFAACCGNYLSGRQAAPTALALMRSRYSAFQLRDAEYFRSTWEPGRRPATLNFDGDSRNWTRLEILKTIGGSETDERGVVEFKAWFDLGADTYLLHEISRFQRASGAWVYLDGTIKFHGKVAHQGEILRNAPCPCGSDKKFKKCCGK